MASTGRKLQEEILRWSKTKLYIWGFKIHIVRSNPKSPGHNWKIFSYFNAVQDDKRPQFTDFATLVNEKN